MSKSYPYKKEHVAIHARPGGFDLRIKGDTIANFGSSNAALCALHAATRQMQKNLMVEHVCFFHRGQDDLDQLGKVFQEIRELDHA